MMEKSTNYAFALEQKQAEDSLSFHAIREASVQFFQLLPDEVRTRLYNETQRGICPLDSEPRLNAYMFSYGKMHNAKLRRAYDNLSAEFRQHQTIDIVDYGCGQAMGCICYADFLRENGIRQRVRRVVLIEPSELALARAALHVSLLFPDAEIRTVCKGFDDLLPEELCCDADVPMLHILSNVLDLGDKHYDLDKFADLIANTIKGNNEFVCVEPLFGNADDTKLPHFIDRVKMVPYFQFQRGKGEFVAGKNWTCVIYCGSRHKYMGMDFQTLDDFVEALNEISNRIASNVEPITTNELILFCDINDNVSERRYCTFYKQKKRKGRYRRISAPIPRLKLILRCINELFQTSFYIPPKYVTGFVRKSSIVNNGEIHVGQRYIFTIDLTEFFESVKLDVIDLYLRKPPYCFNDMIARVIAVMSCVKNEKRGMFCLSQGSPLSPILSNIVCTDMDKQLNELASFYGARYSRYADDITFSSHINLFTKNSEFKQSVKKIIDSSNFRINKEKVHVYGPQSRHLVTGIVTNEKINIPREYIRNIRNLLYIWDKYGINEAYKKFDGIYTKRNKGNGTPFIGDFLRGQIEYLGTVRGKKDSTYLRFKSKFDALLAIPFEPFCGKYYKSMRDYGSRVYFNLSTPILKNGQKYYTAISDSGERILISPKLNEYIESGDDRHHGQNLEQSCVYYRIFDKDGVKLFMAKK